MDERLPLDYSKLSPKQFDAEIKKGFDAFDEGKTVSSGQIKAMLEELSYS